MSSVQPTTLDTGCEHTGKLICKVYEGKLLKFNGDPDIFDEVGCSWNCSYHNTSCGLEVRFTYDGDFTWNYATFSINSAEFPHSAVSGRWGTELGDIERPIDVSNMRQFRACPSLLVTITECSYPFGKYSVLSKLDYFYADFAIPSNLCDGAIVIDEKTINVSKAFLAMHSTYFNKLFYGGFAEKNNDIVVLKDISFKKFVEFLHVVLPGRKSLTKWTLKGVLEMADFFDCESARRECSLFLHGDKTTSNFEKLRLADRYQLMSLEDVIFQRVDEQGAVAACKYGKNTYSDRLMLRLAKKIAGT